MPSIFPHERLEVYQRYLSVTGRCEELISQASASIAALDHLDRATESIGVNLMRANAQQPESPQRSSYLDVSIASTHECAASLDVCFARRVVEAETHEVAPMSLWRIRGMLTLTVLLFGLGGVATLAANDAVTFRAEHKRFLRSQTGELTVSAEGIAFQAEKGEDRSHRWSYDDIQELRIDSPRSIRILSYEDVAWRLNRDRAFDFELIEGEITAELAALLAERLPTPLATAVFPEPERVLARVPAKHRHALGGGCDGELVIADEAVFYLTPRPGHSRWWPLERIESVGAMSEFDFRVNTREGGFHFQLKRPLDRREFESLWRRIHEPRGWLDSLADRANRPIR